MLLRPVLYMWDTFRTFAVHTEDHIQAGYENVNDHTQKNEISQILNRALRPAV